jgi:adenylosuccinate lyase
MTRSSESKVVRRLNATLDLLKEFRSTEEVVGALSRQFGMSRRQAYRYIREARQAADKREIPEEKVTFTVKLPSSLVVRLKGLAASTGQSLSALVAEALESFLRRGRHG